jgi:hypothetical protein
MSRTEEIRRQRFEQSAEGVERRRAIERWVDSTEASRAGIVRGDQDMGDARGGDQDHDADQSDGAE